MGILSKLVLAPLAPVTGVIWLAEQLERQAMELYYSPEAIAAELDEVRRRHQRGELSDRERDDAEAALLGRLFEARNHG